jgi:hypothetical protein
MAGAGGVVLGDTSIEDNIFYNMLYTAKHILYYTLYDIYESAV